MQICHLANIQPVNRDQYVDMQQCLEFASAYKIDFEVVASKQTQTYEVIISICLQTSKHLEF